MNIKPLYTILVEEDLRIDAGDIIKIKGESGMYDTSCYIKDGKIECKFSSCDDEGIWVEIEKYDALIYFLFTEIYEITKSEDDKDGQSN